MQTLFSKSRFLIVLLFFVFCFTVFALRLVYLQVVKYPSFKEKATSQYSFLLHLDPERGNIYDRHQRTLAYSLKAASVFAVPPQVSDKGEVAHAVSDILDIDEDTVIERLSRQKMFIWLKRKISDEEADKVAALKMRGIEFIQEPKRFYPNGSLASHVLGVADIDNRGLEGIELSYEQYLRGEPGWREVVKDAVGRELIHQQRRSLPPSHGYHVILTIDEIVQHITEKALEGAVRRYNARSGTAIVIDPHTGMILALANYPTFNPNDIKHAEEAYRRNRAITDCFEPGSSFKVITASAALNENLVTDDDVFFCEEGAWATKDRVLRDHRPHGNLTFRQVIEKSSNIGIAKVALRLREQKLYDYIKRFGFGETTGIDLPGEVGGLLSPPSKWSRLTISSIPMGQEIGVTAIQMAAALSVIANGGVYYQPMVVREIQDERGEVIGSFAPRPLRRVISSQTAATMRELLQGVVENGTGKHAQLASHSAGGKTGTAQKVEPNGTYSHSKFIASFVGFAPVEDPKVVVCVFIDEPKPVYYGGSVAAPIFKEITDATLKYVALEADDIVRR